MKAKTLNTLSREWWKMKEPFEDVKAIRAHLLSMAKLGFTSTTIRIKTKIAKELELRLRGEGYTLYDETSNFRSSTPANETMLYIDWDQA